MNSEGMWFTSLFFLSVLPPQSHSVKQALNKHYLHNHRIQCEGAEQKETRFLLQGDGHLGERATQENNPSAEAQMPEFSSINI